MFCGLFFFSNLAFCLLVRTDLRLALGFPLWIHAPWRCGIPFFTFPPFPLHVHHGSCPFGSGTWRYFQGIEPPFGIAFFFLFFTASILFFSTRIALYPFRTVYTCIVTFLYPGTVCNLHTWLGDPGGFRNHKKKSLHWICQNSHYLPRMSFLAQLPFHYSSHFEANGECPGTILGNRP